MMCLSYNREYTDAFLYWSQTYQKKYICLSQKQNYYNVLITIK